MKWGDVYPGDVVIWTNVRGTFTLLSRNFDFSSSTWFDNFAQRIVIDERSPGRSEQHVLSNIVVLKSRRAKSRERQ